MTTRYVVGFLFTREEHKQVLLIRKSHPEWQKGKLNGVGGHVEAGETFFQAMHREFVEETGILHELRWVPFLHMCGPDWECIFFRAHIHQEKVTLRPIVTTDELVDWYDVHRVPNLNPIPNLRWLIPMALDENVKEFVTNINIRAKAQEVRGS